MDKDVLALWHRCVAASHVGSDSEGVSKKLVSEFEFVFHPVGPANLSDLNCWCPFCVVLG